MALFELNSDITIGNYRFSGVNQVRIKKGLKGYVQSAAIALPSIGSRQFGKLQDDGSVKLLPGTPDAVTTGTLFTDGMPITINLGYNGQLNEEFRGFIKRRTLSMPLVIECEGYARQLRLNNSISGHYKKTSAKELLELACKGTDISVQCPVDFPLSGIRLVNASGTQIIDHIKKCSDNTLTIFFIEPTVLWCGLVYTPYLAGTDVFNLPTVNYRLGWNVVRDNGLKERTPSDPVQIIINGKTVSGDMVRTESKDKAAAKKVKCLLNNVPDNDTLQAFAQEKQLQMNYAGYEGVINSFLQPYALEGYSANIVDSRYTERNGIYMIDGIEVDFGVNGARRKVAIGPKLNGGNN